MKYLLLALTSFLFLSSCVTQKYSRTDYPTPFEFESIDTVSGYSRNDLFVKANEWIAKTFVSANEVIQMKDKEAGKLIAKGLMTTSVNYGIIPFSYNISFTMSIDVKDGRYKAVFSDYIVKDYYSGGKNFGVNASLSQKNHPYNVYPGIWSNIKGDCLTQTNQLKKDLTAAMHASSTNW